MNIQSIVTLTLNPAIDKSTATERLIPEAKLRCTNPQYEPGGGGVNVSRAIKKLGGDSIAVFPSGAHKGDLFEKLLDHEGVNHRSLKIKGPTRENFVVVETSTNHQYRFTIEGPQLSEDEAWGCLNLIQNMETKPSFLVVSGSMPKGVPQDFMAKLGQACKNIGTKLIVDTSGEPLKMAVEQGVYLLKPNLGELSKLAGRESIAADDVDQAAMELIKKEKVEVVVVSLGAGGALLVTKDIIKHIPAPSVYKKSTVGAGDSMVAGMVLSLAQGKSLIEMAQFGVACGTAATMNSGTELCKKEDAERLFNWIVTKG